MTIAAQALRIVAVNAHVGALALEHVSATQMPSPPLFFTSKLNAFQAGCSAVRRALICLVAGLALSGCDQLGVETPQKLAERQMAEARAVGSACRHALRAIEDCYTLNPKSDKSSVFAGWREMDEYMRENKLEGVPPVVPRPALPASAASKPAADEEEDDEEEEIIEEGPPKGSRSAKTKRE